MSRERGSRPSGSNPVDRTLRLFDRRRLRPMMARLESGAGWYDLAGVRNALAGLRIPLLENFAVLLGREGKRFWVAGIGDQVAHRVGRFCGVDDLPGTLQQITAD